VNTLLGGSQFQIFTSAADAGTLTDPVAVDGATTFTSNATTNLLIEGLKAGNYWVVETIAPVGYVASTTPIPVTITVGSTADALLLEIENTQVPAWLLPLTGGGGAGLFAIGGGVLVAIAIGAAFVFTGRRKVLVAA
jgi:hypothetical protein